MGAPGEDDRTALMPGSIKRSVLIEIKGYELELI